MINFIKPTVIALGVSIIGTVSLPDQLSKQGTTTVWKTPAQNSDAAVINDLNALCIKQLRASALAIQQGGTQSHDWGSRLSVTLSKFNDEIRSLAKNRKIVLSSASPDGGLRPDGRIDTAPENLRDTSRIKNGGGEAGNDNVQKVETIGGINDAADNALIGSLKKLKGTAFDQAYRNLLISDRATAETLLTKASQSNEKDIKAFGKKYLNALQRAKAIH